MGSIKKGYLAKPGERWKHMKWFKRVFWKKNRNAEKREARSSSQEKVTTD